MTALHLIRTRLAAGRYEAVLSVPGTPPVIEAVHLGKVIAQAHVVPEGRPDRFAVTLDLPATVIGDGAQVVILRNAADGAVLDQITLLAGATLDEDYRAELVLLREELALLKRAFRHHCQQTGAHDRRDAMASEEPGADQTDPRPTM